MLLAAGKGKINTLIRGTLVLRCRSNSQLKKKLNEEEKVRRDGGAGTQILRRTYVGMQNSRHAERCIMTV